MFEVMIVGSGVSGVAAALRFADRGVRPCVVDVGMIPDPGPEIDENFYAYRNIHDSFSLMIGENFEGLINLSRANRPIPVKLISPLMKFVTKGAAELSPLDGRNFSAVQSFAQGGLANAWGAGLYRCNDRDLEGVPLADSELAPYFERLSEEIGISGANDDLVPFFGRDDVLQEPLRLSANASRILEKYRLRKKSLNAQGAFIGRPRLAVLTEKKDGRKVCDYRNLEFWFPGLPYIYSPVLTLRKLIEQRKANYIRGVLVRSWSREGEELVVHAMEVDSGKEISFRCRRLVLAAGAVGSARLALQSRKDFRTRLKLLDNPAQQFPFVLPCRLGRGLEVDSFGLTQLNFIYDTGPLHGLLQGSILEMTSPARAEFFEYFPWAAYDNLRLIRFVLPAMVVLQLFFPGDTSGASSLRLREDGTLEIKASEEILIPEVKGKILKIFRKLGAYGVNSLVVDVPRGHSIHYAGTLPMTERPKEAYTCSKEGELYGEPGVFVVDGSLFPVLPAKNLSFAVMANAMRIADFIVRKMRGQP